MDRHTELMEEDGEFDILPMHQRKIKEVVQTSKKFTSSRDFLKNAVEILLAWESKHPEDCMALINELRPFSPEQAATMDMNMKKEQREKFFGKSDRELHDQEHTEQKALGQTDYDHMKMQGNYPNTVKYIKSLKISEPENVIGYDGYPLLSSNYRRFLPEKLVLITLAHLMESKKTTKVELKELRVNAYDFLEEYGIMITKYEKQENIKRQNKMSTGFPKKINAEESDKNIETEIRTKDIMVGKTRTSRVLGGRHFEGALSGMGLVYAFEEEGKIFVTLTETGKRFFLEENPIFPSNDFSKGSFTKKESEFIMKEIIPQRELEKSITDRVISVIREFEKTKKRGSWKKKDLAELESSIQSEYAKFAKKNPKTSEKFNISHLATDNPKTKAKMKQKRLAVMGRLAEIGVIEWSINQDSISEYYMLE